MQIGASFTGLDGIADTRDIVYDVTHFEKTLEHVIQTIADGIAFLPVIGAGKYADETVGVVKKPEKQRIQQAIRSKILQSMSMK